MKLYDIFNEDEVVDEVRMDPSSFATAIEQGDPAGVLVGFEFEVCVPIAVFDPPASGINGLKSQIQKAFVDNEIFESINFFDVSLAEWDQLFQFKKPLKGYNTMTAAYNGILKQGIATGQQIFDQIPEDLRVKYKKTAMQDAVDRAYYSGVAPNNQIYLQAAFLHRLGYRLLNDRDINKAHRNLDSRKPKVQKLNAVFEMAKKLYETPAFTDWSDLTSAIGPRDHSNNTEWMAKNLNNLFEYDPEKVYTALKIEDFSNQYDDYDDIIDPLYSKTAQVLQPLVAQAMGRKVHVFGQYHERKKNLTDWYIEPDRSIDPNAGDSRAEIVSPPLPALEAVRALNNFYTLAQSMNFYTNKSTGLHINVSIPGDLDVLKLAVFVGDQAVLQYFKRDNNDYAVSILKYLQSQAPKHGVKGDINFRKRNLFGQMPQSTELKMRALKKMASNFSSQHTASVSYNGNYVSFRHAGGDYLADQQGIVQSVGRFVRAMMIASNKDAYRQEYITKLSKLVNIGNVQGPSATGTTTQLQRLRTTGLTVRVAHVCLTKNKSIKEILQSLGFLPDSVQVIRKTPNSAAAKTDIVNKMQDADRKTQVRALDASQFVTLVLFVGYATPRETVGAPWDANRPNTVHRLRNDNYRDFGYYTMQDTQLPPNDPVVQHYIKQLMQQAYSNKK